MRASPYGHLFKLDNFVSGRDGTNNIWVKGYYTYGNELIDCAMDILRKEAESSDCLQGF